MKIYERVAVAALLVAPLALGGCLVRDDDPAYVPAPSSTTVIHDDKPDVHVTPAPNVNIERTSPPVIIDRGPAPNVNIDVKTPDIEIKKQPPTPSTTGF